MSAAPTSLPHALAVPGLSLRPLRGEEDAADLAAVRAGCALRDRVDPLSISESVPTRESMRATLARALANGQQAGWLIAEVQGHVVGYSQLVSWPEADGTLVYLTLGWVLPSWRGQGIGTCMLKRTEERIRRLAADEHPGARSEFAANASSTQTQATALLLHEGYRAAYTVLEMGLDPCAALPTGALPEGIHVRPVTPDQYPAIAHCVGESYKHEYAGGRFGEEFDPDDFISKLRDARHDPTLWQVAWDGEQVVGVALSVVEGGRAEVFEVCVRPGWRRRGIARGLLTRALHNLRARGCESIRLRTVAEFRTRARDLYESVGFGVLKEFPRYRKAFV